jgi:transcription elongation factor SPT5
VVLDPQTVGVIVGVDKDSVRVLTNQGRPEKPDLRVCGLPDLKRKMDSKRASAQDGSECSPSPALPTPGCVFGPPSAPALALAALTAPPSPLTPPCSDSPLLPLLLLRAVRNEVSLNDIVEVFDGPLKGRSGTVKHIMRGFLFVQSREVPEHGGFTCVQARHCKVRGGRRLPGPAGAPGVLATPARAYAGAGAAGGGAMGVMASPARQGGFGAPGAAGGYTGRVAMRQDKLLENKVVDIRKGPYRGMRGRIVSATPTHVRVELEAQMKTVTVDRAHLPPGEGLVEGQHAARPGMGMGAGLGMGAAYGYGVAGYGVAGYGAPGAGAAAPGGRTPAHYSQAQATPAHYSMLGGSTPLHPGMTPGREAVTATPAYDAAWAATPAHPGFGGGGGGFGGGGGHDPFAGHGFGAPPPPSVGSAPYAPYGAPAPPPYGAAAPPPAPYSVPPASMPPPPAPAPPPPAPVPPPAPGGLPQDWVGLEVCLLSGQRAAVRSVDHQGAASVQLGQEAPPGSGALAFADGPVRVVRVADLALAPVAKGDRVRLLGGELKGMVVVLDLVEAGEVFFKRAGGEVALEPAARAGKLAPDAAA